MSKLKTITLLVAFFISINVNSVSADGHQTIVEIASGNADFSALVEAVVSQDLVETLNSEGPFTVFAPTNTAFAALPSYVGNVLAEKPELLTDILLYHVVAEELLASQVLSRQTITTAGGSSLAVNASDAKINQASITATDIAASNGVIHVIDSVLVPQSVTDEVVLQLMIQLRDLYINLRDLYLTS